MIGQLSSPLQGMDGAGTRHCPRGHDLCPGEVLVGHQYLARHGGGHTTWTCHMRADDVRAATQHSLHMPRRACGRAASRLGVAEGFPRSPQGLAAAGDRRPRQLRHAAVRRRSHRGEHRMLRPNYCRGGTTSSFLSRAPRSARAWPRFGALPYWVHEDRSSSLQPCLHSRS